MTIEPRSWEGKAIDCHDCPYHGRQDIRCAIGKACIMDRLASRIDHFLSKTPFWPSST